MFCQLCGWFYNPNQKCGCYRDTNGKVVRQGKDESAATYFKRVATVKDTPGETRPKASPKKSSETT